MYGVLEFVGQDGHIEVGAGFEKFGIYIDDLALVAVWMHIGRIFVVRAIVSRRSVQFGMQYHEAWVAIYPGTPNIPKSIYDRGPYPLLEQPRPFLKPGLVDGYGIIREPVGILAHDSERRADFSGRSVVEFRQPEVAPVSDG